VTLAFAAGALCISAALALGTYLTARHLLVDQRERTATRAAFADASIIREGLLTAGTEVSDVLGAISPPAGTTILVRQEGDWYSTSLDVSSDVLPAQLTRWVDEGTAGVAWTSATDPPGVVVGLPLPAAGAQYYEVSPADELDRTLSTLGAALAVGAGVTTIGGAALGLLASRRLLSPLGDITAAATNIAAGNMHTRLAPTDDPDLAALVGAFNSMVDALDDRIQRDARFAADVSHELRSPLTTLTTSVSVLQRSRDLPPRTRSAVELIAKELERFRNSLEDLLAISKLEAGVHESELSTVDLRAMVRTTLQESGWPAPLLTTDPDDSSPIPVTVDRRQVRRALVNLFSNADHHGRGLTAIHVTRRADFADVSVDDEGPGVPPEDREHIFERFARSGSRGSHPGTGLGLSIVAEIARLHGGSVWCADAPGGGARFVFRLPIAAGEGGLDLDA
jgi:signal transduction histidine kinase